MPFGLTIIVASVVGLVLAVTRVAASRDRSSLLWGGLAVVAACAAFFGSWRWILAIVGGADAGAGTLLAATAILIGPAIAVVVVLVGLALLPPGRARIGGPIAVRMSIGSGTGEAARLQVDRETLRIGTSAGQIALARVDLAEIRADGEVLRLKQRDGEELRLHVMEHDDPYRRRRLCDALAAALRAPVAGGTARQV